MCILELPLDKEVQETATSTEGGGLGTGRCGAAVEVGMFEY